MEDLFSRYLNSPEETISLEDYQRLASAGETRFIERKSLLKLNEPAKIKELSQAVSAFANYDGGVILLGVSNDGQIESGVEDKQGTGTIGEWLQDIIAGAVTPLLRDFGVKKLQQRDDDQKSYVYAIFVGPGNTAYQAHDSRYYARLDGKLRAIDGRMVLDIINRKRNSEYKLLISFNASRFLTDSVLDLRMYVEVTNQTPLEDVRFVIKLFGGQTYYPRTQKDSSKDDLENSHSLSYDSALIYPSERILFTEGKLGVHNLSLQRHFEVVIYARNAAPYRKAFVIDASKALWIGLYEFPLPEGDIQRKQLWRYSREWLEEPTYLWDSSLTDRRSEVQKAIR